MRLQLIALATSLPIAGGFASHTCVDDDAAVPQLAGSLGVSGVTSCAEVVAAGYCPHIPEHLRGYCCATCAGYEASDRSARNGAVKETEYGTRYCNIMNYANPAEPCIPPAKCRNSRERVTPARTAMLWTLASPTWAHSTGRRPGLRTSMPGTPRRTHPSFSHELPVLPLCRCRGGLCMGENGGFPCEGNEALKLQPWHPLRVKYEKYACGGTLRGGYECYDKCCEHQDKSARPGPETIRATNSKRRSACGRADAIRVGRRSRGSRSAAKPNP